jgi:hypothetical protein
MKISSRHIAGRVFGTAFAWAAAVALVAACSSEAKRGESCDQSGKVDGECESGLVCGKDSSDKLLCLKVCVVQTDCAATEECNGVDGSSLKGCRTKK